MPRSSASPQGVLFVDEPHRDQDLVDPPSGGLGPGPLEVVATDETASLE
ncbi:MAG: hypothetical protein R3C10_19090 [Pirellulales bacterium]